MAEDDVFEVQKILDKKVVDGTVIFRSNSSEFMRKILLMLFGKKIVKFFFFNFSRFVIC